MTAATVARSTATSPPKSAQGKGKQRAAASSRSEHPAPKRLKQDQPSRDQGEDSDQLLGLAERIADNAHLLARGRGSDELARLARDVAKRSFDRALQSESVSFPHLSSLLSSLSPSAGPSTRSAASRTHYHSADPPAFVLAATPIAELTTQGMDAEMVWDQMELRGRTVDGLMEEMFGQTSEQEEEGEFDFDESVEHEEDLLSDESPDEDEEEDEADGDSEDEGDEAATPEEQAYFRRLGEGKEEGLDSDDLLFSGAAEVSVDEEDEEDGTIEEVSMKQQDPLADGTRDLTLSNFDGGGGKVSRRRSNAPPSAVDDAFFSLSDFHAEADEGEVEMDRMLRGEALDEDEDEAGIDLFAAVGDSDAEDSGEEEEGDLDAGGMMYRDFFDPPSRPPRKAPPKPPPPASSANRGATSTPIEEKRGVRFSQSVKVKEIPHRLAGRAVVSGSGGGEETDDAGNGRSIDEDDEDLSFERQLSGFDADEADEDMQLMGEGEDSMLEELEEGFSDMEEEDGAVDGEDEEVAQGQEAIERFKDSLFDDEEDEDDKTKSLSRHERRLLQLSSQIANLEAENVGPKGWATLGEAKARDRPVNAILEEDLEFERMGKVAPMVTEETTKTIEELIKKRILDNQFDDVERRRPVDPNAFLPSRFMELQDNKSQKSLAEVYEDEYRDARAREDGQEVVQDIDKDLEKRHHEIEELFEDLAARLDALSNARFTPKAPKATITTVSNLPSISVESALPTTNSTSMLLAPEEVYSATGSTSALVTDKADLTPAQKKAQRQKAREQRKGRHEKADRILQAQQRRKGVKGEKENAEQKLIGLRGVTVIGKNGVEKGKGGKKRKRGDTDDAGAGQPSSVSLKL
ncbi:hypothetical protein JCM11641_003122 [Rhodosporidiobolus odoratus]